MHLLYYSNATTTAPTIVDYSFASFSSSEKLFDSNSSRKRYNFVMDYKQPLLHCQSNGQIHKEEAAIDEKVIDSNGYCCYFALFHNFDYCY